MTTTAFNILNNEKDPEFQVWLHILKHAPTKAWEQPVLTFIESVKEKLPNGKTGLSVQNIERCNYFMYNIARYVYGKKFGDDLLDGKPIKNEMLNATALAKQGKMYEPKFKVIKNFELPKQFAHKLNCGIPKQFQWGFCAIVEFSRDFNKFIERTTNLKPRKTISKILETTAVEQIFPNNWEPDTSDPWHEVVYNNEPDGWNNIKIRKSLNTIGNLVLLEQSIHKYTNKIHKGNFLAKRKNLKTRKDYKDSVFNELMLLCTDMPIAHEVPWSYTFYKYRQKYSIERLTDFFTGFSKCISL
ncbi:MAG: HNH endonuclease family protein, partial [Planctomycetaceae bacterium]|jgi:hypothetical protein|nr:HNH endonuclease family protein [Planctomycetaceae bacterium]